MCAYERDSKSEAVDGCEGVPKETVESQQFILALRSVWKRCVILKVIMCFVLYI